MTIIRTRDRDEGVFCKEKWCYFWYLRASIHQSPWVTSEKVSSEQPNSKKSQQKHNIYIYIYISEALDDAISKSKTLLILVVVHHQRYKSRLPQKKNSILSLGEWKRQSRGIPFLQNIFIYSLTVEYMYTAYLDLIDPHFLPPTPSIPLLQQTSLPPPGPSYHTWPDVITDCSARAWLNCNYSSEAFAAPCASKASEMKASYL